MKLGPIALAIWLGLFGVSMAAWITIGAHVLGIGFVIVAVILLLEALGVITI